MHNYIERGEGDFHFRYDPHVHERSITCYNSGWKDDPCTNVCHFLIAGGADDDGYPPVFGVDCEVTVLCWGGDDIDNSTIQAYCRDCALAQERLTSERQLQEEAEARKRRHAAECAYAERERQNRTQSNFWLNLSDLEFEVQCAELFRKLGFAARTTALTNDGGLDIILERDGERGAAQCKAWLGPSGVRQVREFYGALHAERLAFGYFISRRGFTRRAQLSLLNMPLIKAWSLDDLLLQSVDKV